MSNREARAEAFVYDNRNCCFLGYHMKFHGVINRESLGLQYNVPVALWSMWTFGLKILCQDYFFADFLSYSCFPFHCLLFDIRIKQMETLRCFNCHHSGRTHEDFFNISKVHRTFAENSETCQDGASKENILLVCADCVYDRLQECRSCAKKAPLCMFKISEWFRDKESRNCIDCAATFEAVQLFQTGYPSSVIIRQCSVCQHFKYLPSFITWSKHKPHDVLKDCFECQLRGDIVNYKTELRNRYEEKLQQEPVLGNDNKHSKTGGENSSARQGATYASVVTKGFSEGESFASTCQNGQVVTGGSETRLDIPRIPGVHKGKCFSTCLEESFCEKVLQALKTGLIQLEEKTKLELQLLQSDSKFWQVALRDKLLRVSQLFSSQATDQIHLNEAESHWAYLGTYTAAHASLIHATVTSGRFEPLTKFVKESHRKERLHVCCLGAGPGSEVLGFYQFLPSNTEWLLLDNCEQWIHTAQVLLKDICGVPFRYGAFDIRNRPGTSQGSLPLSPSYALRKAKLFLLVKFVSAIQNLPGAFKYLSHILRKAVPGALFLFVDNAHIQTKNFIEDLVFPLHDSKDRKEYKENESFKLYTTYAELQSGHGEGLKSLMLCEWVSLISNWLDRHPILDLRVNIHLAVKKG